MNCAHHHRILYCNFVQGCSNGQQLLAITSIHMDEPAPPRSVVQTVDGSCLTQQHAQSTSRTDMLRVRCQHDDAHPHTVPSWLCWTAMALVCQRVALLAPSSRQANRRSCCQVYVFTTSIHCSATPTHTDVRASAAGFVVVSAVFLSWATLYLTRRASSDQRDPPQPPPT